LKPPAPSSIAEIGTLRSIVCAAACGPAQAACQQRAQDQGCAFHVNSIGNVSAKTAGPDRRRTATSCFDPAQMADVYS